MALENYYMTVYYFCLSMRDILNKYTSITSDIFIHVLDKSKDIKWGKLMKVREGILEFYTDGHIQKLSKRYR